MAVAFLPLSNGDLTSILILLSPHAMVASVTINKVKIFNKYGESTDAGTFGAS